MFASLLSHSRGSPSMLSVGTRMSVMVVVLDVGVEPVVVRHGERWSQEMSISLRYHVRKREGVRSVGRPSGPM